MKNVFFKPWVGKDYESGGIFGRKVLVVGESHHCDQETCPQCGDPENAGNCANFTNDIISSYLTNDSDNGRWTATFRKFERSLIGQVTDISSSKKIWNSIAFYNYLQKAMNHARQGGTCEDYKYSEQAFWEVMEDMQPDLLIGWGVSRLYSNMPNGNTLSPADNLVIDGYHVLNRWYTLNNGKMVRAIWIYHPSVGYSWDWWHKVIRSVLYSQIQQSININNI